MKLLARTLITTACMLLMPLWGLKAVADGIGGSGVIKYFGSVVIDGVHYDTVGAVIRINGRPASEADLKVGYHVSFRADGESQVAWSVDYYDSVAGPLESVQVIDAEMQIAQLVIMGHRVNVDADTWLHGVSLETLEPGMPLAVSAQWQPNGELLASAVDAVSRPENVLSGWISGVDGHRLTIGSVVVDAGATGLQANAIRLQTGERVHVVGHYDGAGTLYATRLVRPADLHIEPLPVIVEGVLEMSAGHWQLGGHRLDLSRVSGEALRIGSRATVNGVLQPSGLLVADRIRADRKGRYRLDGVVEAVHGEGEGITVDGHRVLLDEQTSLRDDRDGYRWLSPSSLGVHDAVSLIVEEVGGVLKARKVTRAGTLRRIVRGQVRQSDWWRGPELLAKRQAGAYRARQAYYDGRPVPAWRLRFLLRKGDVMTLRFDADGSVVRADVVSENKD